MGADAWRCGAPVGRDHGRSPCGYLNDARWARCLTCRAERPAPCARPGCGHPPSRHGKTGACNLNCACHEYTPTTPALPEEGGTDV